MTTEPSGYLSLVLHAHLPFVRHPEHPKFLEEGLALRGDR
jgi:1,4-alpha-glucan branching enzyme